MPSVYHNIPSKGVAQIDETPHAGLDNEDSQITFTSHSGKHEVKIPLKRGFFAGAAAAFFAVIILLLAMR